jgi:hypothetical protein
LNRRWLLCGLALTAAAGIPVLAAGYGADPDAWLVASAAETLWTSGRYVVSRFPGYPLHEIISAPLVGTGGWTASNAGTLAAALVLTWLWYRVAGKLGRNPIVLFFSLLCAPLFLTNVATTMDYLWSLACLLGALDAALEEREVASGVLTGIAAGFRPSNLTLAIPLAMLIIFRAGRSAGIRYLASAAAAAAAGFLPVLVSYGGPFRWFTLTRTEMSDVHPAFGERILEFGYRILYAAGPVAFTVFAAIVIKGRETIRSAVRAKDPVMCASFAAVIVMVIQFFALPLDRAYLLPALPFALIIADRLASPRMATALLLCIASLNVFNPDITAHDRTGRAPALNLHEGRIAESLHERALMMEKHAGMRQGTEGGAARP